MESLFPQLFFLSFFVPTALRIGAAIFYALLAQSLWRKRAEIAAIPVAYIGKPGIALALVGVAVSALIAAAFAFGIWTQAAAIIGFLGGIKGFILAKRYPVLFPHGRETYFLLALICLSLIVLGAGALAIDKPY